MNETPLIDSQGLRKAALHRQIADALDLNEEGRLFLLETKWVHRYGLETLPKTKHFGNLLGPRGQLENDSFKSQESPLECTLKNQEQEKQELVTQQEENLTRVHSVNRGASISSTKRSHERDDYQNSLKQDAPSLNEENQKQTLENLDSLTPPPRPSLSHLRRWLPAYEDLPRAS